MTLRSPCWVGTGLDGGWNDDRESKLVSRVGGDRAGGGRDGGDGTGSRKLLHLWAAMDREVENSHIFAAVSGSRNSHIDSSDRRGVANPHIDGGDGRGVENWSTLQPGRWELGWRGRSERQVRWRRDGQSKRMTCWRLGDPSALDDAKRAGPNVERMAVPWPASR